MRSRFFQIPPVLLAVLLQLAPLVRWMSAQSLIAPQSAWAVVFRLSAGTAALLGAVDAVSGASDTIIVLAKNPAPTGTNGVTYPALRMDLSGDHANDTDAATWSAKSLPPGLNLAGTARQTRFISGTPTQAGSNWVSVTAAHTKDLSEKTTLSFAIVVVSTGSPPGITSEPSSLRVVPGGDAAFAVTASGSDPLTYQWKHGSTLLPTATNATLTLTNVALADAGAYSVVVSNASGTATSQPAQLLIAQPPLLNLTASETKAILTFPGETGVVYRVESATTVDQPAWQFVTNVTAAADIPVSFTNSLSSTGAVFLRLKLQSP
jgi:hypothetical protein